MCRPSDVRTLFHAVKSLRSLATEIREADDLTNDHVAEGGRLIGSVAETAVRPTDKSFEFCLKKVRREAREHGESHSSAAEVFIACWVAAECTEFELHETYPYWKNEFASGFEHAADLFEALCPRIESLSPVKRQIFDVVLEAGTAPITNSGIREIMESRGLPSSMNSIEKFVQHMKKDGFFEEVPMRHGVRVPDYFR